MKKKHFIIASIALVFSIVLGISVYINRPEVEKVQYKDFVQDLESGKVEEIKIKDESILTISLKDKTVYETSNPQSDSMREYFLLNGASINENQRVISDSLIQALGLIGIGAFAIYYMKKNTGKDKLEVVNINDQGSGDKPNCSFEHVAGNDEAKELVMDIIDFIKDPDKYAKLGAKMPRGILLYGPPGTGKTLMAKAIAGESGVPFYAVSGSDFVQMYVGVGASRIRQLFQKAKKAQKAVIFIDEIDAIGKKRGNAATQGNDERDQTLNALLTEMSGFNSNSGIVVIAATNRLETLDEALVRPGRFDRLIEIGLPDIKARKRILNLHLDNKPVHSLVDTDKLARETVYFSGAMLENLANEAAIIAANKNESKIFQEDFDKAYYTIIAGAAKKDLSTISTEDRKVTAYHESGHALATKLLQPENTVSKVTIIPSTKGIGGFSMSIPRDRQYRTKNSILCDIKVLLAGRVAEELAFGEDNVTTGASNDIEKASQLVKEYLSKFGMDEELGLFNYDAVCMNPDPVVIEKCRDHINTLYQETRKMMKDNIDLLNLFAKELLERETLNEEDLDLLIEAYV